MRSLFRSALINKNMSARGQWTQLHFQKPGDGQVKTVTLIPGVGIGPEITRTFWLLMVDSVQEVFEALHAPVRFDVLENFNFEDTASQSQLKKNECILLGVLAEKGQKYTDNYKFYKYLDLYANVTIGFSMQGIP